MTSKKTNTAVIYHELLHADMTIKGIDESLQHQYIADNYINVISYQLRSDFPNLSQADADALASDGLGDSTWWQKKLANDNSNNTQFTGDIVSINANYKNLNNSTNGNYGTLCTN
jgi:hypothetical protein